MASADDIGSIPNRKVLEEKELIQAGTDASDRYVAEAAGVWINMHLQFTLFTYPRPAPLFTIP